MDAAVKVATVKLLINGQFVESKTTEWRDVVNPATQQVLARVPFATREEVELAVAEMTVLSRAETPPFVLEDHTTASEELRLKHRALDLLKLAAHADQLPDELTQGQRKLVDVARAVAGGGQCGPLYRF